MKIYVLLSRIPWPLEKGDKLRAYNQIKYLSQRHEIVLVALNADKLVDKTIAYKMLEPYCKSIEFFDLSKIGILFNLFRAFICRLPMQCGYFYNKRVHKKIHNSIVKNNPDVLFGQLVRVAPYLIEEKHVKVIDYQDVFSFGMKRRMDLANCFKRIVFRMEYQRLKAYENYCFEKFDIKTIISESDRNLIEHTHKDEILIIPNGVDFDYYKNKECEKKYDLIFSGNMSYPPNVNAVEYLAYEIMPIVWKKLPEVSVCIAGATPDMRVRKVSSEKIIVTGWIDDMREAYSRSKVFIAPMRIGTGLQNKLLEAMAMNLPCITTNLANGSLLACEKKEILVGNTAEELAENIILLLTDKNKSSDIAKNGCEFVHRVYSWSAATSIMESSMNQMIQTIK